MEQILLDNEVRPKGLWNTHIDCLQVVANTACRDLDIIDVAGITGLAFRTALCAQAIPPSTYLSWSFQHAFSQWLSILGVETSCSSHNTGWSSMDSWADRQTGLLRSTAELGFPSIYWDNLAFGLVVGIDGKQLNVTGIPAKTVHPVWYDHPHTREFTGRLVDYASLDETRFVHQTRLDSIASPGIGNTVFCACPTGVSIFDQERALVESLYYINAELRGRIEYPRIMDDDVSVFEPQFGTTSMKRLRGELETREVHDFGLIQFVQVTAEARGLGCKYLKRYSDAVEPEYRGRLEQVTEFFLRTQSNWGTLKRMYDVPLNREEQMRSGRLFEAREQLYQIEQTEKTAGKLLCSIVAELFEAG